MTRIVLVAVTVLSLVITYTAPAYACGVKLTVKAPRVKKKVKPSDNPSRILLVGEPPNRLTSSLSEAGHSVEVAEEPNDAKRERYAVVIADREKVDESQSRFPRSPVIARSGSTRANLRAVERTLAEGPSKAEKDRMVARRSDRSGPRQARRSAPQPRRATTGREVARTEVPAPQPEDQSVTGVATLSPSDEKQTTPTTQQRVAVATIPRDEVKPRDEAEPRDEAKPSRNASAELSFKDEFFFGPNSVRLSRRSRVQLAENARWLKANPDTSIRVEGHTDLAGPADYNMTLSERRADAVKAFLVKRGVDSSRIETVSRGEEEPAYPGKSSKNRRVVIVKQ